MSGITWSQQFGNFSYKKLLGESSYIVAGRGAEYLLAEAGVERTGSQFMRRVIAALVGQPEAWDYKLHSHRDNIMQTIETFAVHKCAAACVA